MSSIIPHNIRGIRRIEATSKAALCYLPLASRVLSVLQRSWLDHHLARRAGSSSPISYCQLISLHAHLHVFNRVMVDMYPPSVDDTMVSSFSTNGSPHGCAVWQVLLFLILGPFSNYSWFRIHKVRVEMGWKTLRHGLPKTELLSKSAVSNFLYQETSLVQ